MTLLELLNAQVHVVDTYVRPARDHVAGCETCINHDVAAPEQPNCPTYRALSEAAEAATGRVGAQVEAAIAATSTFVPTLPPEGDIAP